MDRGTEGLYWRGLWQNLFNIIKWLQKAQQILFNFFTHVYRLQPPPAVVLHDLLHHPACASGLPWHERVQEEVRLCVGRVLPNCSLPDHSPCLLRKQWLGTPELRPFLSTQHHGHKGSQKSQIWMDWPIWLFRIFILRIFKMLIPDWRNCST